VVASDLVYWLHESLDSCEELYVLEVARMGAVVDVGLGYPVVVVVARYDWKRVY